jgi:hypothetical protein
MNDEREQDKQHQVEKFNFVYHMPSLAFCSRFGMTAKGVPGVIYLTFMSVRGIKHPLIRKGAKVIGNGGNRCDDRQASAHLQVLNQSLAQSTPRSSTHPALQPCIFRSTEWRINSRCGTPQLGAIEASL